jgi:hypothetical protein
VAEARPARESITEVLPTPLRPMTPTTIIDPPDISPIDCSRAVLCRSVKSPSPVTIVRSRTDVDFPPFPPPPPVVAVAVAAVVVVAVVAEEEEDDDDE